MPQSDSLTYVHGTGTSVGNITSTANAASSVAITGTTMTVTTMTTGQIWVGQQVNGTGVAANTFVTGLGTGVGGAGTYTVSPSQTVAGGTAMTFTPNTPGDSLCLSGSQYSNLELDFGPPASGNVYPWLPQFPSLTEKTQTSPPEVVGQGGIEYGLIFEVCASFNLLTSINIEICTSATTAALYTASGNPIASRTLTLAQLQVSTVGFAPRYFISIPSSAILEYLRFYAALTGTDPTYGTCVAYFGPRDGGLQ
jgi:hypothetical protein